MKDNNLQHLMKGYFRHQLNEVELEQLKQAIIQNPRFRQRFVDECLAHEEMCQILIEKVFEEEWT